MAKDSGMNTARWLAVAGAAIVLTAAAGPVAGQTIRATLTGTVTDPNGAVITGVAVTATNVATNISAATKTNNEGFYTFTALTPGDYVIAVEQKGFKRFVQSGVVLQIAQATRLDIPLEVGQVTEEVSVIAATPMVSST